MYISADCVRQKYQWANCKRCAAVCHLNAIKVTPTITLDSNICDECGQCVENCPFTAIVGTAPSYNIRNNILYEDNQPAPLLEKLLLLRADGINEVCVKSSDSDWFSAVQQANQVLCDNKQLLFKVTIAESVVEEIQYSKRAFLHFSTLTLSAKAREGRSFSDLSKAYPEYQFYRIALDHHQCTLCGICAVYCHQNCIHFTDTKVVINSQSCDGCQLCQDVCQLKALELTKEMRDLTVMEYPVSQQVCSACHQLYRSIDKQDSVSLCPACRFRQQNNMPLYKIGQQALS